MEASTLSARPSLNQARLDDRSELFSSKPIIRGARIKLPNVTAHASLHAIVENQIALNLDPVVRAMHRLGKEGLTRHDAGSTRSAQSSQRICLTV